MWTLEFKENATTHVPEIEIGKLSSNWISTSEEGFQLSDDETRWERYSKIANHSPETGVALLADDVRQRLTPRKEATEWLFARLVASRSREESPFYKALLFISDPEELTDVALEQYRQRGYEERLSLVASLLGDMGRRSWPALRVLASNAGPESEYFVSVIASLDGVSPREKIAALAKMARSCDLDVLWGILNVLQNYPELRSPDTLLPLVTTYDEQLNEEAKELLAALQCGLSK